MGGGSGSAGRAAGGGRGVIAEWVAGRGGVLMTGEVGDRTGGLSCPSRPDSRMP